MGSGGGRVPESLQSHPHCLIALLIVLGLDCHRCTPREVWAVLLAARWRHRHVRAARRPGPLLDLGGGAVVICSGLSVVLCVVGTGLPRVRCPRGAAGSSVVGNGGGILSTKEVVTECREGGKDQGWILVLPIRLILQQSSLRSGALALVADDHRGRR